MPEIVTTIASIITIFNFVHQVQNDEMDVFINGNQVAETTPAQIIQEGEQRREEILIAALEHRQRILSQTTLK
jgi:uncharacterized protein (DUF427 family)